MAALLASEGATAAVPAVLMEATVRLATFTATGQMIAGAGSATALSAAVLRALFMIKLKWISTAVLVLGLGASGTAVIALQQAGGPPALAPAGHGSWRSRFAEGRRRRAAAQAHRLKILPTWSSSRAKLRAGQGEPEACPGPRRLVRPDVREGLRLDGPEYRRQGGCQAGQVRPGAGPGETETRAPRASSRNQDIRGAGPRRRGS